MCACAPLTPPRCSGAHAHTRTETSYTEPPFWALCFANAGSTLCTSSLAKITSNPPSLASWCVAVRSYACTVPRLPEGSKDPRGHPSHVMAYRLDRAVGPALGGDDSDVTCAPVLRAAAQTMTLACKATCRNRTGAQILRRGRRVRPARVESPAP